MKSRALAVVGLVGLWAGAARGGITTVDFSSDYSQHRVTKFEGVATYDSGTGKLNVAVNNTGTTGGFLTGIALSAKGPGLSLETSGGFADARNHKGIVKAGPLGKYHAGATTGESWSSGGRAAQGVAAGASRIFTFDVKGANADSLTVADFFTPGKTGEEMVARFRKIPHHHNDRGGAVMSGPVSELFASQFDPISEVGLLPQGGVTPDSGPTPQVSVAAVPAPSAGWAGMTMLGVLVAVRMMMKRRFC